MRNRLRAGAGRFILGFIVLAMLAGLWVLNASRMGSRAEGCPAGCAAADERAEGPLRVMSLNVLHGYRDFEKLSERLDLIAQEIRRQDADIVLLQEVPWTLRIRNGAKYLAERTELNYLYLRANGNRWTILFEEGEAILSRYPLVEAAIDELRPRAEFFEHRVVLSAVALTPQGKARLFVTHLTDGEEHVNRGQAESLMDFVNGLADNPAIIGGDFNAEEGSSQIQGLAAEWVDTYRTVHPTDDGYTCCIDDLFNGPEEVFEKRIDYLFVAQVGLTPIRVVRSQRVLDHPFTQGDGWLWASDHVGLLAAIELGQ